MVNSKENYKFDLGVKGLCVEGKIPLSFFLIFFPPLVPWRKYNKIWVNLLMTMSLVVSVA